MLGRMVINRLDKEALIYELTIRGNCVEMGHRLSMAMQLEKAGDSLKYPKYPYTFHQDYTAVKKNLDDLIQKITANLRILSVKLIEWRWTKTQKIRK